MSEPVNSLEPQYNLSQPSAAAAAASAAGMQMPQGMMKHVLIGAGVLVALIILAVVIMAIRRRNRSEPLLLSTPTQISQVGTIQGSLAPLSVNGYEYAYSFWMFIQDWSTSYGMPKCVLYRSNDTVTNYKEANPSIWLYPKENKLMVRVSTYPPGQTYDPSIYPTYPTTTNGVNVVNPNQWSASQKEAQFNSQYTCDVGNLPLQRWVHVVVCCWDRTLDVYLNGKLARSCLLPGVPVFDAATLQSIYVGQGDTYNGYMSRFKYYNRAITPKEVLSLYRHGPLPANWLWNSLKTKIQMSLNISSSSSGPK